jgi:formate dehydrogenase major subunit
MGGMLRYGIPEFRLPKTILDAEIALIKNMGITFNNNVKVGADITLKELKTRYDAIVIAIGAWSAAALNCLGEDLNGVFGGIDFLRNVAVEMNPLGRPPASPPIDFKNKRIAVIGGGNTAMDACRVAVRLGAAKVYNIYRRSREEMPACDDEILETQEEGVIFKFLVNPLEIIGNKNHNDKNHVTALNLQNMELGEPDEQGRRRPIAIEGSKETLEIDAVIVAIGQKPALAGFEALNLTRWGTVEINDSYATNSPAIFAIGDAAKSGGIAIEAIADAKKAALAIDGFLKGEPLPIFKKHTATKTGRTHKIALQTSEDAKAEALRCLKCYGK